MRTVAFPNKEYKKKRAGFGIMATILAPSLILSSSYIAYDVYTNPIDYFGPSIYKWWKLRNQAQQQDASQLLKSLDDLDHILELKKKAVGEEQLRELERQEQERRRQMEEQRKRLEASTAKNAETVEKMIKDISKYDTSLIDERPIAVIQSTQFNPLDPFIRYVINGKRVSWWQLDPVALKKLSSIFKPSFYIFSNNGSAQTMTWITDDVKTKTLNKIETENLKIPPMDVLENVIKTNYPNRWSEIQKLLGK